MLSKKNLLILALCASSSLQATMTSGTFAPYPNYYFVETGTHKGDGVKMALASEFAIIHSIEIDPTMTAKARNLFKNLPNVHIWQGDSATILKDIIKDLLKPITFWLDGHRITNIYDGKKNTPLLAELEQIKQHPIKTHTIIIDDLRCCGSIYFDYMTKEELIKKVLEINPNYTITYIDGAVKNDILVARVLN